MAFVHEVASPPRSHLSILRGKGTSDREYSSEHFIPSPPLLHHTPLKSHFTSSWSVGLTCAAAVAAGQVYPGSIWPRWAVEHLRSVPATSCLHRVGQCQKAAQSFWSMCNAGSVRGHTPWAKPWPMGWELVVPIPHFRLSGRQFWAHSISSPGVLVGWSLPAQWFSGPWSPLLLAFPPFLFPFPSPSSFSLESLPKRTALKLLLCTNITWQTSYKRFSRAILSVTTLILNLSSRPTWTT